MNNQKYKMINAESNIPNDGDIMSTLKVTKLKQQPNQKIKLGDLFNRKVVSKYLVPDEPVKDGEPMGSLVQKQILISAHTNNDLQHRINVVLNKQNNQFSSASSANNPAFYQQTKNNRY